LLSAAFGAQLTLVKPVSRVRYIIVIEYHNFGGPTDTRIITRGFGGESPWCVYVHGSAQETRLVIITVWIDVSNRKDRGKMSSFVTIWHKEGNTARLQRCGGS
jgi:hypothetical protein